MVTRPGCAFRERLPDPVLPDHAVIRVVGIGGVGAIVVRYLAIFLAALNRPLRLVIVDGDTFEESNASRQMFAYAGNKAEVVREELLENFAGTDLTIEAVAEYVTPENVDRLIREHDIVLAALDNHKSRLLLTERCLALDDVTLISGGNDGVGEEDGIIQRGTMGSIQVHHRRAGVDVTPPLTRYHPEIAAPADKRPDELSCLELQASHPQLLFTNLMTASCILNALMLHVCDGALHYSELSFDVADGVMRPVVSIPNAPASSGSVR
jgi:ThiF family